MFLDDLLEACVIELGELGQIVYIGDHITQILLQQHEIILGWNVQLLGGWGTGRVTASSGRPSLQAGNDFIDFFLTCFDSPNDLSGFYPLKSPDFVELGLQLGHETLLVILIPGSPVGVGIFWCGSSLVGSLEGVFQMLIRDVIVIVVFQKRGPQLLAKAVLPISARPPMQGMWKFSTACLVILLVSGSEV